VVVKVVGDLIWERARNQRAFAGTLDEFQVAGLSWRWRMLRKLQSWYTSRADAVICPSAYLGGIVSHWGVPVDRIRVVYNAVRGGHEARLAPPDHDLVTVARLVPWKGIAELIQVAAELRLSLLIVGDGPLRAELESLARNHGASAPVSFAGHVDGARVEAEIRRGRVFVLNSSYEGLPHIVLEAKVAGVPVIATAAGGTPEAVGAPAAGVLVPVGDRAALAREIAALLADEAQQRRLVEASHAQLSERFSFATMVRETEQVLASCVCT
jgi:glycosyltransferase involved in cell wall biosynthesis